MEKKNGKIVFFEAKSYDIKYLEKVISLSNLNQFEIVYIKDTLDKNNIDQTKDAFIISIFVSSIIDNNVLAQLKANGCQFIALRCAGYDRVNLGAATAMEIAVTRVPEYSPQGIAEMALSLYMCLERKLDISYEKFRHGDFEITENMLAKEMKDLTTGIIGTGKIGKITAGLFKGITGNVVAYDVYKDENWSKEKHIEYLELDDLISQSDIISLHLPLFDSTYHLINNEKIEKMKNGVILINTSRGGLVDTKSVIKALKSGKIAGFGSDVYENETEVFGKKWDHENNYQNLHDPIFKELIQTPNVFITPHQAYFTTKALSEISKVTISNIEEFLEYKKKNLPFEKIHLKNQISL